MWLERLLPDLACSVSGFRPARRRITVERPRRALAVQANESALRRVHSREAGYFFAMSDKKIDSPDKFIVYRIKI